MHQCMQACRLKGGEISYFMYRILLAFAINQSISVMCKHIAGQCLWVAKKVSVVHATQ